MIIFNDIQLMRLYNAIRFLYIFLAVFFSIFKLKNRIEQRKKRIKQTLHVITDLLNEDKFIFFLLLFLSSFLELRFFFYKHKWM